MPTEEVLGLLKDDMKPRQRPKPGYVDVLGKATGLGPHATQRLFGSRLLPPIYDFLRRLLMRFLCGHRMAAEERRIALQRLDISPGDRVLDLGCGPGTYTRLLAEAAGDGLVVGLDASEAMVAAAAKRGGSANLVYVRADGEELPFGDGHFDAVCCVGVIHLFEDPLGALDEMVRMLAPGGRLMVGAPCRKGAASRTRLGVTIFSRDALPSAFEARGLADIEQRADKRAQVISARKSPER